MSDKVKYPRYHKMSKSELLEELRHTKIEIAQLKAENERLVKLCNELKGGVKKRIRANARAEEEITQLKAERDAAIKRAEKAEKELRDLRDLEIIANTKPITKGWY